MIYCDHNATTPLRPEVLEAMLPYLRGEHGNPSSVHALGSRARCAVEDARAQVASFLGVAPATIVFTSGGTESNNLAILGAARGGGVRRILVPAIEHASVLAAVRHLGDTGLPVDGWPVGSDGRVDVDAIRSRGADSSSLVSVGWANNEVGTVQPISAIRRQCREVGALLHVDAVQAAGKIPISVGEIGLMSVSAHKIGGPKGVGALYVRPGLDLQPLWFGGEQERGRRAGTENVAAIVGMGQACALAQADLAAFGESTIALRDRLWVGLSSRLDGLQRNSPLDGLPNTLHVSLSGIRGETLVAALDMQGIAVSSGSACAAGAGEPSHVLMALGHGREEARHGLRFSFGRGSKMDDVDAIVAATVATVQKMRARQSDRSLHV